MPQGRERKRFADMTPEEQARERRLHDVASKFISNAPPTDDQRQGILDLTVPGRTLHMHQTSCLRRVLLADRQRAFGERRLSLLAMHPMGSGKTISATACVAGLYKMVPQLVDFVVIIVAPKSVLATWVETLRSWTTLGDAVVMAEKESDLTAETFCGPKVTVTTKDAVLSARKTYMYYEKEKGAWVSGVDRNAPHSERVRKRASLVDGALPKHPLFAGVDAPQEGQKKPITLLCFDEAHEECNPDNLKGGLGAELARRAQYVLGLSGTPVSSNPSQAAHLCHLLNAHPVHLQDPKQWMVRGTGKDSINHETVAVFHHHVCDVADPTLLGTSTHSKTVYVRFDPFIGRRADGTYDEAQHQMHNRHLTQAQGAPDAEARGEEDGDGDGWMQRCTKMVQLCFSATLGMHGAEAFRSNKELYKEALKHPSQQMRLIWRLLRHRQRHGRVRIVVYSPWAMMLELLRNQLVEWGGCGRLFLYTGKASSSAEHREGIIADFLGPATTRGVLLISGAGAIGTSLCPGCETIFVVGDLPWTKAELRQAESRVLRLTQREPVEIVHVIARNSVMDRKYFVHHCEEERLYPAIENCNFERFKSDNRTKWKLRDTITSNLVPLDALGNYSVRVAATEAPPPVLADDFELPPVTYPVQGYVEPQCADSVALDGDDDNVEPPASVVRKRVRDDDGDTTDISRETDLV